MSSSEIFVVEDDPAIRRLLAIVLTKAGYQVICFADGEALIAATRKHDPLCILLDVCLPGKSGLEILRELKAHNYPAPVLMISGTGTIDIAVQAVKAGAIDFVQKPFGGAQLLLRISDALEQASARRAVTLGGGVSLNLPGRPALTSREREILAQTLLGKSNKEMSQLYGLSPRTIEEHRSNIKRKTGAKNLFDLVRTTIGWQKFEALLVAHTQQNGTELEEGAAPRAAARGMPHQ
jgi:FixJ family two-component response regulator